LGTAIAVLVFETPLAAVPSLTALPLYIGFIALLGGGNEEPGWRGYLLPVLQSRVGAFTASITIGIIWTFWHIPLFLNPANALFGASLGGYVLENVASSIVLTWLFTATGGRLVPVILFHTAANTAVLYLPVEASGLPPLVIKYLLGVLCSHWPWC
jgi:membrane protease YdiL (CAAX protease family)